MDSNYLYKLVDGKSVLSQEVDENNRLIYVFDDNNGAYAQDCQLGELRIMIPPATVTTKLTIRI